MFIETQIEEELIADYLKKLNIQLKRNIIKTTIDQYFLKYANEPLGYFKLRDNILPNLIGEEESKIFFWCIFIGFIYEDGKAIGKNLDEDTIIYLEKISALYIQEIVRIKKFNINPNGYYSMNFLYSKDNEYNNLIFTRNDNEKFLLRVDLEEYLHIMKDLANYYKMLLESNTKEMNENIKILLENVLEIADLQLEEE